ncbi:MAG: preprotein translocase subunit SecE [Candidatus Paraimprobicoccus trichonymphae]|uniref:Protein translocase subunit SecE n=1 Tax=Candidatus Paraimprobicoccus trichonymphae TaxID=3033793 RepID=A0AA48HZ86_9FIRM|nr:MAG: preprotein translocase subunit SecE [Candidatus Paraimprobicoccus trichonymphae]
MEDEKVGLIKRSIEFFKDLNREMKKIIWPTARLTFKNTWIVLLMITIVGIFVFILDVTLMQLLGLIMEVSRNNT